MPAYRPLQTCVPTDLQAVGAMIPSAPEQVPDDPSLLDRMMADLRLSDELYRPTNYWAYYERHFLPELQKQGLRDFRRRHRSVLTAFGATDLRPKGTIEVSRAIPGSARIASGLNRLVAAVPGLSLGIWGSEPDWPTIYFYFQTKEAFARAGLDLSQCGMSTRGNPEDCVEIDGANWSLAHLQYCAMAVDALARIRLPEAPVICELGTGLGRNLEVFARLYPEATLLAFDIPPQLYVANQYLASVFGNRVLSYPDASLLVPEDGLPASAAGRIVILPTWRLPAWSTVKIDLFWNSASFQEMEPHVVLNYLRLFKSMKPAWVYINALPKGNYWGPTDGKIGGTLAPVGDNLYGEGLGAEYVERTRYPTNYFLRDRDYVSYVYRRVTE